MTAKKLADVLLRKGKRSKRAAKEKEKGDDEDDEMHTVSPVAVEVDTDKLLLLKSVAE